MKIADVRRKLKGLSPAEQAKALELMLAVEDRRSLEESRKHFLPFVERMWPEFISGHHHKIVADAFERVALGDLRRLIISMPPRHTKSEFASMLFPAWYLGLFPEKKIIQSSHTAELAVGFGRRVRNTINSDKFQEIFPGVEIASDSKAAGRWNTNKGGNYFAVGVGGAMAGVGADILVIDDPHNEQEAAIGLHNPEIYDRVYEWYTSGPRQRLQPGGSIIVVQTRWSKRDLAGQLIKHSIETEGGDEWEVIQLPAILPSGSPLWPEFWSLKELNRTKAGLPISKWMAQYQQDPTSEEGALIKREWWRRWEGERVPKVESIIQSWDTAFEKTQRSNYSACTTWGVFYHADDTGKDQPNLILLDAYKDKLEFPELKMKVLEQYKTWEPDCLVVERRASGGPLIYELRSMGVPVHEFTPSRGNDKLVRVNAITDIFASGFVWHPDRKWATDVIEECASFPAGEHDDFVDSVTQALLRFRQGGWVGTKMDEEDIDEYYQEPREYY